MAAFGVVLVLCISGLWTAEGITIKECSHTGWVEIREDSNTANSITCQGFSATGTPNVTWTLTANGTRQYVCDQSCNYADSDVTVQRYSEGGDQGYSVLTIVGHHRSVAGNGNVTCRVDQHPDHAECRMNVVHPAVVTQCRTELDRDQWVINGSCRYEHAFSSNGTYTCVWNRNWKEENQSQPYHLTTVILPKTEQDISGQVYYEGTCTLSSILLPVPDGRYSYTVDFLPGPQGIHVNTIEIEAPGEPVANCTSYVAEGHPMRCECQANSSRPGSPLPVFQWHGQTSEEPLDTGQVTRSDTGTVYSCQALYGTHNKTTIYSLNVAYGPDDVTITERERSLTSNPTNITLVCRAVHVFPSAVFNWTGVSCSSSTSDNVTSSCTFTPPPQDVSKVVTCTAENSQFPQLFRQAKNYTVEQTRSEGGDDGVPLGAIIGAVVAGVAVIIIVIIVFIRRKRRDKPEDSARESVNVTEDMTDDDDDDDDAFQEHINPIYGGDEDEEKDGSPTSMSKPSAMALRIPSSSDSAHHNADHHAGSQEVVESPEALSASKPNPPPASKPAPGGSPPVSPDVDDLYSSVDGDDEGHPPARNEAVDDGLGDYAVVDSPDLQSPQAGWQSPAGGMEEDDDAYTLVSAGYDPDISTEAPQTAVYAVVDKSVSKASPSNDTQRLAAYVTDEDENAYTIVDLTSSAEEPGLPVGQPVMEAEGNEYAQVQKPKSGAKPKPEIKPKPVGGGAPQGNDGKQRKGQPATSTNYKNVELSEHTAIDPKEVAQDATNDDEYNALNFFRPPPQPETDGADDSVYSHITQL